MRPIYANYNAVTAGLTTPPFVLDQYIAPANTSVTIVSYGTASSVTVALDFTTDNVLDQFLTTTIWQPYTAAPFTGAGNTVTITNTGAVEAMFIVSPKAVRVRVTAQTNNPNIQVQVVQAGIGGT